MYVYIKFCREFFKLVNIGDVVVFIFKVYWVIVIFLDDVLRIVCGS